MPFGTPLLFSAVSKLTTFGKPSILIYEGELYGISVNGKAYFYRKNLQGDIIEVLDRDGNRMVRYEYDAWGKCTEYASDDATQIVELNPYRYRGYYYDAETELYYLQSRYYDPELGRFLNADSLLDYTNGITSNLLCYCINNPVIYSDEKGYNPGTLFSSVAKAVKDFAELYYNISLYIRFELSSLIYIVYKKGKRYYSYTSYIIGDPHSCQPLDGLKKLPKKALLIGAIHTYPNSNFFSNADM